jgi:hypothetical protein
MVIIFQLQILSIIYSIKLIPVNNAIVKGFIFNHVQVNHVQLRGFLRKETNLLGYKIPVLNVKDYFELVQLFY